MAAQETCAFVTSASTNASGAFECIPQMITSVRLPWASGLALVYRISVTASVPGGALSLRSAATLSRGCCYTGLRLELGTGCPTSQDAFNSVVSASSRSIFSDGEEALTLFR